MKFEMMAFKLKEWDDPEHEQTGAGDSRWLLPIRTPQHDSVLVLREVEESERAGRCCRVLKYQTKSVWRSKETDLKIGRVFSLSVGQDDEPDKRRACESSDAEHDCRAELEFHTEGQESGGVGVEAGREKNGVGDGKGSLLEKHERTTKIVCKLCGKEYARSLNLVSHMRIHTGETPYTCPVCQRGFRRQDWLSKHMNVHKDKPRASPNGNKQKRHACDQCERTYKSKHSLLQHLRVHTGVRAYQCAICRKRFYFEAYLHNHLRCHSDDRPFTCSQCGHGFKRAGTLRKHMRIHTGEKPYSCTACGKKLRYRYSMSVHMKTCPRSRRH